MNINLKLLHTFLLVAEHESFRQAAEESNRSPSAISMQIRDLELQLGLALFQRTTRRVELTPDGAQLLGRLKRAMVDIDGGIRDLLDSVEERRGRVRLASSPTIAATCLPGVLSTYRRRHPHIVLGVRELVSPDLLAAVRNQDVDFGISPGVPNIAEFAFEPLIHDEFCAVAGPAFRLRGRSGLALRELVGQPIIMLGGATALRQTIEEAVGRARIKLDVRCEVQQAITAIAMAAAGLGIAIIPRVATPRYSTDLSVVPIVDPPLSREIGIVTLRGQSQSLVARQLIDLLCETLRQAKDAALPDPVA